MEKPQFVLGNRESGTVSGAAPTFFVILKQQQGNGKADQGILVANRDACALASSVTNPVKSKVKTCLPADCVSGGITVTLDNNSMWNEFYHRNTEMILTKQGRRMFPYCRYWITGLDSNQKYILVMDISPVDNHRYKWNGRWWEPSGKAEPHVLGRVFIHPESPSTGQYWMHQPVSFYKLKLTNNTLDQEGHIILHSMHRYLPRLHLVPADKATEVIQLNGPDVHTFTFPQTEFFAVTAYQNIQITQLKIDYNPFAKGFRDDGLNSRPQRDIKQNNSEQEGGSVSSSPSNRGRSMEADGLDSQQRDLESSFSGQNPSDVDLEKESFNAERDFLGFLDADMPSGGVPKLKQEVSESPIASSYESSSRVASPLDPNGHFNVVVKEEPVDDYAYGSSACIEGVTVKQEDTDEETDEYSNSDDDPILEKQLRKHSELDGKEADVRSRKRILTSPSGPSRRGRPRKLKISKAGRPPKNLGKTAVTSKNASLGPGNILPDVKPDLEDVDGVLFVSFASKEALDIHTVDRAGGEESQNVRTPMLASSDPACEARICHLEKELMEDLKSLRHKQVIHPSLQEVGLKLNSVDPTLSIDLKYLGVQLPLSYSNYSLWNYPGANPSSPDGAFPFVSRTGKTNDFTKIKGWRGKFHGASRNEGSSSEGSLKNRSAFYSDKLDEYLENEGKLMETSLGFSPSAPTSPVVYQLPTKSTSYVRTLDSVLKKQSNITPSTSYTFKPLSVSSTSRRTKTQNKQAASNSRSKPSYKPILPSPVVVKQKHGFSGSGERVTKSAASSSAANQGDNFMVPALDENMLPKQISLRQAQQQQAARLPGLSKSQVKLMDLEDCALWDGKPRTYITEERADISLATLLTAQASLKNKPIHKIIRRRAPPCNNDFCRLGCICASLALEKRQPTHCRRPDCMFGCICLKRKVLLIKGGSRHKRILKRAVRGSLVFYGTPGEEHQEEEEVEGERDGEDELKQKDRKKRKKVEYTICDTEPEQPVRNCPLWVKVEGEVDPEPIYIPTPSVIEPAKPMVLPNPEVLPCSRSRSSSTVKPGRVYTPKPNPVIREEDKDPVYLYFESMMTCARVRAYEHKVEEKKQQKNQNISNLKNCSIKESLGNDSEHQSPKRETCEMEKDTDKSEEKSWWSSCSEGESSSTSYVHQTTPGGPTKLIEIISDCNWEEDRNKILSILSQHINNNMPQSIKVGSFIIELASEHKPQDEKSPPSYSSRVKISMPSYQDKGEMPETPVLETPDSEVSSCKKTENLKFLQADTLDKQQEKLHGGKGLPFYTGLSPAGKLVAYKRKANMSPSGLIQVNGKSYPQAKLLLGQMGALHPANRLAAYITGRLRPTVLDISTLSTVISKVASNAKAAASRTPSVQVPTTSAPKTTSSTSTTSTPTVTTLKAHVPAQRQIAARPSPGGVFTQFVMSKVGALQQKIPGVSTPQPLTGPQKFNIRPTPLMVVSPVVPSRPSPVYCTLSSGVTAATTTSPVTLESVTTVAPSTVATTTVTTTGPTGANESTYSPPGIAITGAPGTSGTNACTTASPSTPTATVNIAKTTEMATPVATVSFPKSVVTSPTVTHPVPTTSTSTVVTTTAVVTSTVTTPTSSVGSVPIILSGINTGPSLNPRPEDAAPLTTTANPQGLPSGTEKRVGPRLLLIPVQGAPPLRPLHNVQLAQGQRMVLQPLRSPGGVNLFRHPNGQIIQLVPLHQLRAAGTQPNVQPVMVRNPGSVVGIQLPGPSKPPETPVSPTLSTPVSSVSPVTSPVVQTVGSKSPQAANLVTQASSILPPVPCFVSQASTLTLRISPPASSTMAGQTCSETKVTQSSGGQPTSASNLIPLQSGNFALLQLLGQKSVPNSILHHVASLQVKKDSKNVSQKEEEFIPTKQQEDEKPEEVEVMESEVTVSDSKPEENELSVDQLTSSGESAASMMLSDRNSVASETADRDSEMLEDYSNDTSTFQHDVSADVISSDHSYISEKNKVVTEKKETPVDSEEASGEVSDNAETVLEVSEQTGLIADEPANTTCPLSFGKQEEAAEAMELKSCGVEQMNSEQAESPDTNQEENAQLQNKGKDTVDAAQPQSPQEKQEHYAELVSKEEQKTQPPDNQKKPEGSAAQSEVKKECAGSTEAESIREEEGNKSEISHTGKKYTTSGEKHVRSDEGCKSLVIQESHDTPNQEQGTADLQEKGKTGKVDSKRVSDSGNKISSHATTSKNKSSAENDGKTEKSAKDYLLTPEDRAQEFKHHKKGYIPTADTALDYMEEEDEDDEKTDDSADEMLDGASDFQSEEEVDVEKLNSCKYSEDEEQVDIETVEELSEKINIARLKATAANIRPSKQKYHIRSSSDEKTTEKSTKKPQFWNRKQKSEAEAFAHYRQTHTANERRRRNEMRDLFEKLKGALGLHNIPKVSKCYILKQAYEEIQGLTDQADKLIGQKNLLTRKQDALIRKVSTLSGKTEEVVLKKLEYIYAKQKAVEAQKKKQVEPKESSVTIMPNRQQEGSIASSRELGQMIVTNRRGKPLILARKGNQATEETTSPPLTLTTASLVMTPQGQVLTLKSPLMPGQMAAVPSTLLQAELKPQTASNTVTAQPGITSVMIQLPGSPVPVQVKGIFTNSTIPIALSAVAGNPVPPAVVTAVEPSSESEDLFMMPKIVNVTSLAAEGGMSLNLSRNKSSQITPGASAQTSEQPLKTGLRESRQNEGILSEEKAKACSGSSVGDGKSAKGPTPVFLENKDNSMSQLRNASSAKDSQEPFTTKLCLGEFIGCQGRRKDADQGGERLKAKDSPFRKLQIKEFKDSRIEMELRKVASAIEEAELDPSEILGGIEESDDTDETLTSLLNEIAFLNQQLNDDNSSMSELPSTLTSDFSPGDLETRRGAASDLVAADGTSFQFGHLGGSFRPSDLSEVREGSGSISPLLLHLEDDDITDGEKNSGEPSSEADILKIVIGSGMKDALPNLSVAGGRSGKTLKPMAEPPSVTPPVLQMKTNSEAGTDTLWRPMPKLAPLGLKAANLPLDSEGQGTKVMPLLAPVVAKLTPVGLKTALPMGVPEGQDNKAMPILAPVVAKVNSTGTLPPNTASK
ncbi:PREDICTED: MAX gene-associated protein isoform X3 [Gavialis gangeticus]|uniref:MAX gene-associated protein isoform X3 n=1 Tax=Gavialis gangeticus TaxID=94835 RepID=UPI00092EFB37|nr:PREDICTED: MAX gene-associated protein isoform X3 [Gavialis gangeticus]